MIAGDVRERNRSDYVRRVGWAIFRWRLCEGADRRGRVLSPPREGLICRKVLRGFGPRLQVRELLEGWYVLPSKG